MKFYPPPGQTRITHQLTTNTSPTRKRPTRASTACRECHHYSRISTMIELSWCSPSPSEDKRIELFNHLSFSRLSGGRAFSAHWQPETCELPLAAAYKGLCTTTHVPAHEPISGLPLHALPLPQVKHEDRRWVPDGSRSRMTQWRYSSWCRWCVRKMIRTISNVYSEITNSKSYMFPSEYCVGHVRNVSLIT